MELRHDGTYVSGLVPWDDWHAGVHMDGHEVWFWRFYPDGKFARCVREIDHSLDFYAFTESVTDSQFAAAMRGRGGQANCGQRLFEAGTYDATENRIHCTFGPDEISGMSFNWELLLTASGLKWLIPESDCIELQFKPAI